MTVEYLLYVQEHLHGRNISLEAMLAEAEQRHSVTQARLHEQAEYVGALEQQLHDVAAEVARAADDDHSRLYFIFAYTGRTNR